MTAFVVVVCGFLGLVIGSFLNVVVWRVPRGESVVHPPSACPSCGAGVRPRDNVPVLSWLLLRGRCRDCRAPISARYPAVELLTGVLFAATAWFVGSTWALPAHLYLVSVGVALAFIDVDVHRLPDAITLPSYPVSAVLLAVAAAGTGDWSSYVRALVCGAVMGGFYLLLVLIYPRGMGLGDVKLAGVLGMYLGWAGWGALVVGTFAAFLVGGAFSLVLVATRRAGRKSGIPFGPWMLVGAGLGIVVGEPLWQAYLEIALGL